MNAFSKITSLVCALCVFCSALFHPTATYAQIYQRDFTSLFTPGNTSYIADNRCIYRDDAQNRYYVGHNVTPQAGGPAGTFLGLTVCDASMNPIVSWTYANYCQLMGFTTLDMDEMTSRQSMIIIGYYICEGSQSAPCAVSIDKMTGLVNWFKLFPEISYFTAIEATGDVAYITGWKDMSDPPVPGDRIYPYTGRAATITKIDAGGNVVWSRQFEDDKNSSSGYGLAGIVNTMSGITSVGDGANGDRLIVTGGCNGYLGGNFNGIWDSDALLIDIDGQGNVNQSKYFGNLLPMDPNGQQSIQNESGSDVVYDPKDNTIVIAGSRNEHPQTHITGICPVPQGWGLWVTKFDLATNLPIWSYRYEEPTAQYYVGSVNIDHDGSGNYGISYAADRDVITKLDQNGAVVYSRWHYLSGHTSETRLYDITHSFDYNNMMSVGRIGSIGWNVETYDNIIDYCEMQDFNVNRIAAPYDIDNVEWMPLHISSVSEPLEKLDNNINHSIQCAKDLVALPKFANQKEDENSKVTGIGTIDENNSISKVTTYPNPVTDELTVEVPSAISRNFAVKIRIFDITGAAVLEHQIPKFETLHNINLSNLPSGVYVMKISSNNGLLEVKKITKK